MDRLGLKKIDIPQAACSLPKLRMETDKLICSQNIDAKDDGYVSFNCFQIVRQLTL